jgi:predicted dehydrogenase
MKPLSQPTRREFMKTSAMASVGGVVAASVPAVLRGATDDRKLKLGLIGCGGRGAGAASQALKADANTELIALGDVFADKLDTTFKALSTEYKERVNVPPERRFVGLDAYQKVIDSGVDVVLLAAPGGFRPPHLKAAIEAGKHVFCEKPMAIDGPGLRSAIASVALAKQKNLALRSGLCMRFDAKLMEAMRRIHGGAIGEVVAIYSSRMGGPLTKKFNGQRLAGWTDLEWQLRNWSNFVWLSGDWMMEVNVHSVDKMAWAMDDVPPVRCVATGGRQVPAYGNIYDHFDVTYEYANGMLSTLKTRYQDGCYGEHRDVIVGTKGRCVLGWTDAVITGAENWRYKGPRTNMHQVEHDELFKALRAGTPPNDGDKMVKSTLMAIMGRMAAYTGKQITWEQAMDSKENLMPANLAWDMKLDVPPMAIPGITPFV